MSEDVSFRNEPWFIWETPYPDLPQVTVDREQWDAHIITEHVYLSGKEAKVQQVIENASHVVQGTETAGSANPDYVVFVNQDIVSQSGAPLVAMVSPSSKQLRTALYHRSFKDLSKRKVLWSRP